MSEKPGSVAIHVAVIVSLVLLASVPCLFTRDLWNPDEPRYMEVAREMVVLGDYVIPHLNGEIYSEKPPLFFWLAGLLWKAGVGYNSGRIVSLLAVCATLVITYLLCRPRIGPTASLLAAVVALTSLLLMQFAKIGVLDPLITLLVTSAVALGYTAFHRRGGSALLCWLGCYVAMGLATLTKGPVGFLVPALILLTYGVVNRRNIKAGGAAHALGFAAFAVVVLGWLIPAILAGGPEYTRTILLKQNIGRAVGSYSHRGPFYYYILWWPYYFFPWSFLLPLAVVAAFRRWRREDGVILLGALWLVVPFAFFSLMSGKRMNYVLPATPAVGIVCAWYLTSGREGMGRALRAEKWLFSAAFASVALGVLTLMAGVLFAPSMIQRMYAEANLGTEIRAFLTPVRTAAALAMLGIPLVMSIVATFSSHWPATRRAVVLAVVTLLLSLPVDLLLTPAVNTFKSGRDFGATINRYAAGGKAVCLYGNEYSGVYNLWTGRVRIPLIDSANLLRIMLADPDALVISDLMRIEEVLDPAELERHELAREHVGHRTMLLLRGVEPDSRDASALPEGRISNLRLKDPTR